jgi:hypothetical protein
VLHFLTIMIGTVSLYLLFRLIFDRTAALFTAAFFAIFTFSHSVGGGDYHSEFSGGLFALAWYLAVRAPVRSGNNAPSLLLTRSAAALSVHSNILFANLAPFILAHWYLTSRLRGEGRPSVVRFVLFCTIGAVAVTALLGLINWIDGRDFLFFMTQFNMVLSYVADNSHQKPWWQPWSSGFFWNAGYLGPLAGGFLVSLFALGRFPSKGGNQRTEAAQRLFLVVSFVTSCGIWALWHTAGQTALNFDYFAYPLSFPLLGAVAAVVPGESDNPSSIRGGTLYALLACGFLLPLLGGMAVWNWAYSFRYSPLVTAGIVFGVALVALNVVRPLVLALAIGAFCLGASSILSSANPESFVLSTCRTGRYGQALIETAHRLLNRLQPAYGKVYVWFDKEEKMTEGLCGDAPIPMKYIGMSLASTGFAYLGELWEGSTEELPTAALVRARDARATIAYVSGDPIRIGRLAHKFTDAGIRVDIQGTHPIKSGPLTVSLTVLTFPE